MALAGGPSASRPAAEGRRYVPQEVRADENAFRVGIGEAMMNSLVLTRHAEQRLRQGGLREADVSLMLQCLTQQLERKHLTLRTRIKRLVRKTICFSKSVEMHDTVIGLFINRYEFGGAV
jgi:hypothetical protein